MPEPPLLHRELGLTDEELARIVTILGRAPNDLELAMYSVMWSEHCSYKSSRLHLRRLPSHGEHVLVGPGENAGVVDAGDGVAVAVRIESHNHPSAVEPYQGAATGVGGILRDVFTMGARPIALMDPLFFGPLEEPRTRYLFDGVVRGIAGYGNAVGVPTVGGQLTFSSCYLGNPLVNVLCLGVMPKERLVLGRASGVGNVAILLGSLTGRDGIGGVSVLASAGFREAGDDKRPSVQVGDPFEEKRLIEACLALLDEGLVVGIQDLGGAGLTCAASETAARAGLGMILEVTAVPLREEGMTPIEVMTSESQERMLAIVKPEDVEAVLSTCEGHEVRATVVGKVVPASSEGEGHLVVRDGHGAVLADLPARSLADGAPLYERPLAAPSPPPAGARGGDGSGWPADLEARLAEMAFDATFVSSQYDHELFLNTVSGPGEADATVLRLAAPGVPFSGKGLALTVDANPSWCALDPRAGAALTVAEGLLNLACVGARPLAAVDCLNFGNPEHPTVMWQLSEAIDGIAEVCTYFSVPVVGGNVSLYNESEGIDIDPTPVVGLVGLVAALEERPCGIALEEGAELFLLGPRSADLAGSHFLRSAGGERGSRLPPLELPVHEALCELVRHLAGEGRYDNGVVGLHDVSEGGLGLCLLELCCASGVGIELEEGAISGHGELFCEAPSRAVVATWRADALREAAARHRVPAHRLGTAGGDALTIPGAASVPVAELVRSRAARLAEAVGAA